jgi:hypothetical protein
MKIELIQKQETDGALIRKIAVVRGLKVQSVVMMLRYNVVTPNQLCSLTGHSLNTIMNMCRSGKKKGVVIPSKLTQVGIMPEVKDGEEIPGRLYILRDDKTELLIAMSLEGL